MNGKENIRDGNENDDDNKIPCNCFIFHLILKF